MVLEGVYLTPINCYIFILAQVVQKCPELHIRMRNSIDSLLLIKKTPNYKRSVRYEVLIKRYLRSILDLSRVKKISGGKNLFMTDFVVVGGGPRPLQLDRVI